MILSVSTFIIGNGAAIAESLVKGCIGTGSIGEAGTGGRDYDGGARELPARNGMSGPYALPLLGEVVGPPGADRPGGPRRPVPAGGGSRARRGAGGARPFRR